MDEIAKSGLNELPFQRTADDWAFPNVDDEGEGPGGITTLEYFIAHAPAEIPAWFKAPHNPDNPYPKEGAIVGELTVWREKEKPWIYFQWRIYYAKQIIRYL